MVQIKHKHTEQINELIEIDVFAAAAGEDAQNWFYVETGEPIVKAPAATEPAGEEEHG